MCESIGSVPAELLEEAEPSPPGWLEGSTAVLFSVDAFGSVVLLPGIVGSRGTGPRELPPSFP